MRLECAAFLACASIAMAQGDDNLGLPQLDAPVPDSTPATGYFTHEGVVYALVGDRAVPLEREVTMRITPGKIIGFDGRQVRLPSGMMYVSTGSFAPLPAPPPPQPQAQPQPAVNRMVAAAAPETLTSQEVIPTVGTTSRGVAVPANVAPYPVEANPPASPATQITAQSVTSSATIPPPQPAFAAPYRPDRTGPRTDGERPIDRTRPESVPDRTDDPTRLSDQQRPPDRSRPGTDWTRFRDRTMPGPDDYRARDRTMAGPDDYRAPDPTRRPDR